MRRLLFVSRDYASDFSVAVSGLHQRLRMLLDAASRVAEHLDILFFADPDIVEKISPDRSEQSLLVDWGIAANVSLAVRSGMVHGPLIQTAKALVDFRWQEGFFNMQGVDQVTAIERSIRHDTDLIVAHRLHTAASVVRARTAVPVVMDLDDIEHIKKKRRIARSATGVSTGVIRLELAALKRGEIRTIRACRTAFVCSETDRTYLRSEHLHNITVVPNAARTIEGCVPRAAGPPTLFFIGAYGYEPNVEAAEFLINEVLPLVRQKQADTRLLLVGNSVEKLPSYGSRPDGVDFVGFVPDLSKVYGRATVVCCSIMVGGGTRIKIIEAAALGKPIVSTTIGAEGLSFEPEVEILLRDSAAAFADGCIALLSDPARARAMGAAALLKAGSLYERGRVIDGIVEAFRTNACRDE